MVASLLDYTFSAPVVTVYVNGSTNAGASVYIAPAQSDISTIIQTFSVTLTLGLGCQFYPLVSTLGVQTNSVSVFTDSNPIIVPPIIEVPIATYAAGVTRLYKKFNTDIVDDEDYRRVRNSLIANKLSLNGIPKEQYTWWSRNIEFNKGIAKDLLRSITNSYSPNREQPAKNNNRNFVVDL